MLAKRILLVEDEPAILQLFAHDLRENGYVVDVAATVAEGQQHLDGQPYALVIADWRLPDGNGIDLADRAVKLRAKTLIISGYLFGLPGGAAERHKLLKKPMRPGELVAAVGRSIGNAGI